MRQISIKIDFEERYKLIARDEKGEEISYHDDGALSFCEKFEKPTKRILSNRSFEINYLLENYKSYELTQDKSFVTRYNNYLNILNLTDFFHVIKLLFEYEKITEDSNKLLQYFVEENLNSYVFDRLQLAKKLDKEADYLINEIIENSKEKSLIDRFLYLIKETEKYKEDFTYCLKMFPDALNLVSDDMSSDYPLFSKIFKNSYNVAMVQEKVLYYIKEILSETAIKTQVHYGLQKFKLERMLLSNNIVLADNNELIALSLSLLTFKDWKTIILNDLKILIKTDSYRLLDNLKQQIKVALREFEFRTGSSVFYERQYELIIVDEMPVINVDKVINWVDAISNKDINSIRSINLIGNDFFKNINTKKLRLKESISPNNLLKIFEYFFESTHHNLNIDDHKNSIKRFVLETFQYSTNYNSFNDDEILFIHPKIDFFKIEYKDEFRYLMMFLVNQNIFENFSRYRLSYLIQGGFDLPKKAKFRSSGHRDFFNKHWDTKKQKFTNVIFKKLKFSILKPLITGK